MYIISDMLHLIYTEIDDMKEDIQKIKKDNCQINIAIQKLTPGYLQTCENLETNPRELPLSFKVDLPITDKAAFERFDGRLSTDKPLKHSLVRIYNKINFMRE